MEDNFLNFVTNKTVLTSLAAWLIAQVLKVLVELFQHKKLDLKRLVDSGGMPSSHSAIVMALFMGRADLRRFFVEFLINLLQSNILDVKESEGDCQLYECKFPRNNSATRYCLAPS